jgi:hypothetical protein
VGGGLIFTLVLAIIFLVSSGARNSTLTVQSILMALPLVGINMLAAWGFTACLIINFTFHMHL